MNRFNLTFSGVIQAGHDPAQVKLRFGKMFAIDDTVRLERFFSGQTIILRRNLERKAAAQYYHELHQLGVVAALVKVAASEAADAAHKASPLPAKKAPKTPRRDKTDIAAQIKASKTESLRLAAEQAAQDRAALEEQQRIAAEDSAREQARAAEIRRSAEEAVARREAERAQVKLREAQDAARKQAIKAETKRQAAADAARQKALREQQKAEQARLKAEKEARRRAELEEIKRQEAEAAARHKAALEEKRRREAEEAARQKAVLEAKKQREAEEAARVQAELEAMQRREAEEAARLQAELEDIQRQEAAEAARLRAELEQIKRQEAAAAARVKAEAQRKEAEAQRQSAERRRAAAEQLAAQRALRREEKRRANAQQAAVVEHHKAEQLRMTALEQQAQPARPQEKAVPQAAEQLAHSITLKVAKARIRTNLEVPQRKAVQTADVVAPAPRKRQSGEPNLYMLRPFRNTDEVRARAAQAHKHMRRGYTLGAIALAALLIAGGSFLRQAANPVVTGASAIVIDPQSAPLLLAGDRLLFHDRAGVSTREMPLSTLGLSTLAPPLAFDGSGALLALGRLANETADAGGGNSLHLLRCALVPPKCEHFSPELLDSSISAFVIHPLDGSLLLADSAAGELIKINRAGQIVARAAAAIPAQPMLRLHGGLLLMNSSDGPAVSVFRYEDNVFGQQLDEILLLPPAAQQTAQSRVGDFLWSSGVWWASLLNPASGSVGLYRFDEKWNYLNEVELPAATGPLQLISWGEKTLVNDAQRPAALRFNAQRAVEAPFESTSLTDLVAEQQRRATLSATAWRAGLLLCALAALLGCGFGYLQKLRSLVYKAQRERGAEPVDDYVDALHWIDPVPNRLALLRRRSISYCLLVLGILLLAIALNVTVWQLAALLLALSGPAIALLLLSRYPVGHIGVVQDKLLLVDHRGMYHFGGGSSVQYHGPFLLIDDVVVFSGSRLLPAFVPLQLQKQVRPLALGGVKMDRNTVVVKLLQCRHPFAQGACVILVAIAAAALLLCLHGIF